MFSEEIPHKISNSLLSESFEPRLTGKTSLESTSTFETLHFSSYTTRYSNVFEKIDSLKYCFFDKSQRQTLFSSQLKIITMNEALLKLFIERKQFPKFNCNKIVKTINISKWTRISKNDFHSKLRERSKSIRFINEEQFSQTIYIKG